MKYIIEHLEGKLEDWSRLEYLHICDIVGSKNVIFTLFPPGEKLYEIQDKNGPLLYLESVKEVNSIYHSPNVCLLDMTADTALTPQDANIFDTFMFGGILGNVPAEDRTSQIRYVQQNQRRNLGKLQMTTDTAVLVTKLVMENQMTLEQIPYVDYPEICFNSKESVELPFRFVSKAFLTKDSNDKNQPIISQGITQLLRNT